MNIKMIVNDLDRTLLRNEETISEYSLSVLRQCRKSGIKVIYATGRGGRSARSVAPCEYFDGKITQGGAVVTVGEDIISKCIIPYEMARSLLIAFDQIGIKAMSEDSKLYYGSETTHNFIVTTGWTKSVNYQIIDIKEHNIDAEKINVFLSTQNEIEFVKRKLPDDLYLTVARNGHGIIMRKEATKTTGIMKLTELWGIDRAEIVSFGDDLIDVDVLKYTGVSVAVANAIDEVKTVADYICDTNNNDGVAKWIEQYIL